MEGVSGGSLSDRAPSKDFSEALFSERSGRSENPVEKAMPPPVLTQAEMQAAWQRREYASNFIRVYMGINGKDPRDTEVVRHLECQRYSNVVSWIIPDDHFKDDELTRKGIRLVDQDNANILLGDL